MDNALIERLISLAKDSPPNSALDIVWRHTFEEGKKIGFSEGAKFVDRINIDEVLKTGFEKSIKKGIEKGIEFGRDQEKCAWGAAGHSTACIMVARPPRGIAIQTDDPLPRPMMMIAVQVKATKTPPMPRSTPDTANSAVQTTPLGIQDTNSQMSPHPSPTLNPIHITSPPLSTSLNWADNAASLPILSSHPPPRNLSALCSTKRNPFSSLQCRSKQFHAWVSSRFHQNIFFSQTSHYHHQPLALQPLPLFPKPQILHHASKNKPFISLPSSCISGLDWDQDPHLSDLSRALKALDWIHS